VVFPLIFAFLTTTAPEGVEVMPEMKDYLDFVLKLFFAFGVAFEVPIATILLVWMGTTTPAKLREKRPYVIVGAFVIGMLLTPPDMISQTLLAIPMWILFEAGIIFSKFFMPQDSDSNDSTDSTPPKSPSPNSPSGGNTSAETATTEPSSQLNEDEDNDGPTDEEMEAELDRIEAEEENEEELERAERARKKARKMANNVRMDHYEPPISERYEPLDETSEKLLDEELEMMDGTAGTDSDSSK